MTSNRMVFNRFMIEAVSFLAQLFMFLLHAKEQTNKTR